MKITTIGVPMPMRPISSTLPSPPPLRIVNASADGTARTIRAVYYKVSSANLRRTDGCGQTGGVCIETS